MYSVRLTWSTLWMCRGSCLNHVRWGRPRNAGYLLTTVSEGKTATHNDWSNSDNKVIDRTAVLVCFDSLGSHNRRSGWCGDKVSDLHLKQQHISHIKHTETQRRAQTNNPLKMRDAWTRPHMSAVHYTSLVRQADWGSFWWIVHLHASLCWQVWLAVLSRQIQIIWKRQVTEVDDNKNMRMVKQNVRSASENRGFCWLKEEIRAKKVERSYFTSHLTDEQKHSVNIIVKQK